MGFGRLGIVVVFGFVVICSGVCCLVLVDVLV